MVNILLSSKEGNVWLKVENTNRKYINKLLRKTKSKMVMAIEEGQEPLTNFMEE